jgi:hypothetical protein
MRAALWAFALKSSWPWVGYSRLDPFARKGFIGICYGLPAPARLARRGKRPATLDLSYREPVHGQTAVEPDFPENGARKCGPKMGPENGECKTIGDIGVLKLGSSGVLSLALRVAGASPGVRGARSGAPCSQMA